MPAPLQRAPHQPPFQTHVLTDVYAAVTYAYTHVHVNTPCSPSTFHKRTPTPDVHGPAGHDTGSVVLHSVDVSAAAAVWPEVSKARILVVRWSPVRPAVFFALDALCTLFTFDLTQSRGGPIAAQSLMTQVGGVAALLASFDSA